MEEFNKKTSVLVYRAIGKKIDETIDSVEAEELGNHYEKILQYPISAVLIFFMA